MFHKAVKLEYGKETTLLVTFETGEVKQYDMFTLLKKYPQLEVLKNRKFFTTGKLTSGGYGIIWNDEIDIETETIYAEGITVKEGEVPANIDVGQALIEARARVNISQSNLAEITGISQADISRIERGLANPSILTLKRLAEGLDSKLSISFTANCQNKNT